MAADENLLPLGTSSSADHGLAAYTEKSRLPDVVKQVGEAALRSLAAVGP
jgi:hypothetical protein